MFVDKLLLDFVHHAEAAKVDLKDSLQKWRSLFYIKTTASCVFSFDFLKMFRNSLWLKVVDSF